MIAQLMPGVSASEMRHLLAGLRDVDVDGDGSVTYGELLRGLRLAKIIRVIQKLVPEAPHDSVIVLDGTVGQNALSQVKAFQAAAGLTGLIITKLDGSAKGGIVVALAKEFGLPVHMVGVGEAAEDLQNFTAQDYARALVGIDMTDGQST